MRIITLSIRNFRNFSTLNLEFDNRNIIFGANGSGKTSIVEAIHYFSILKSFRENNDFNVLKKNQDKFTLFLEGEKEDRDIKLVLQYEKNKGKVISFNDQKLKSITLALGIFPSVIISNYDKLLCAKNGRFRRSFIDRILSITDNIYFEYLMKYHKLLKKRNIALKEKQLKIADIYLKQMSKYDEYIRQSRISFTNYLNDMIDSIIDDIFQKEMKASITYISSIKGNTLYSSIDKEIFNNEIKRGHTLMGIHREDINIRINEMDITKLGSDGERRILGIIFKIAETNILYENMGEYPIVLLDDIFAEIDNSKIESILNIFEQYPQIIITSPIKLNLKQYKIIYL